MIKGLCGGIPRKRPLAGGSKRPLMDVILVPAIGLIDKLIELYIWVIIIGVVLSWLVQFNVVNRSNRFVSIVGEFVFRITEPVMRPIRNLLPNLGGIDISPVVLILLLVAVREILARLAIKIASMG